MIALIALAAVVVLGIVAGLGVWGVTSVRHRATSTEDVLSAVPLTPVSATASPSAGSDGALTANAGFIAGSAGAKVTIDEFEDFLCPYCGEFEQQSGAAVVQAIEVGKLRVRFHLLDFLDEGSASKTYSMRAAGAVLAIARSTMPADQKQKAWLAVHTALFQQQPQEDGATDWSNADLARIAGQASTAAGVTLPASVTGAISSGADTAAASDLATSGLSLLTSLGGQGTPTVLHNGAQIDALGNPTWLTTLLQ
ncbi:DsbA family protein [Tsukamurella soli]|uniref:DsbA family protein n=1 Tax=Tsukamurella soli TaxID=644556 RepID=UPI00360A28DB